MARVLLTTPNLMDASQYSRRKQIGKDEVLIQRAKVTLASNINKNAPDASIAVYPGAALAVRYHLI